MNRPVGDPLAGFLMVPSLGEHITSAGCHSFFFLITDRRELHSSQTRCNRHEFKSGVSENHFAARGGPASPLLIPQYQNFSLMASIPAFHLPQD